MPKRRGVPWRLLLLAAVPVSIVLGYGLHAPAVWVFVTACLGVLPLAGYMGEATEHLAHRTGPTIGGLLNATFGNAAELIIAIVALRAGLVDLVKASITGSILGNLLLILGPRAHRRGHEAAPSCAFNRTSGGHERGHARLAVVALVFPALFHAVHPEAARAVSRAPHVRGGGRDPAWSPTAARCSSPSGPTGASWAASRIRWPGRCGASARRSPILAAATVGVAIESELLVHAATEATEARRALASRSWA